MEQRLFQDLIESDTRRHGTRQSATMPFSAAIHALIALLVVIVPILQPADLPEPGSLVKAFFVEPAAAPAPPPPPPPPAPRAAVARVEPPPVVQNASFVAPIETPNEITPEKSSLDFGVEGGVPGGVEGGVPGGVVGARGRLIASAVEIKMPVGVASAASGAGKCSAPSIFGPRKNK